MNDSKFVSSFFLREKKTKRKRISEEALVTVCLLCVLEENLLKKKLLTRKEGFVQGLGFVDHPAFKFCLQGREWAAVVFVWYLVLCVFFYVLYNGSWNHGSSSCSRDIHTHKS